MRRLLCIVFAFSICAAAQTKKPGGMDFKRMLQAEYDAWDTLNPANVAPFDAKDTDSIFFDIAPVKYNNWAEWEKGVTAVIADYKTMKIVVNDDVHGGRSGNWAWAACTLDFTGVSKNGHVDHMTLRETALYEKRGNQWLIVHEHVSAPLPEPALEKK